MVELMERRVTRSLSNELQNRGQAHQAHHQYQAHQNHSQIFRGDSRLRTNGEIRNDFQSNGGDATSFSVEPLRVTSEEMLIRTIVDGSNVGSTPSMDGLGFASLPLGSRKTSEELFSTWLNNLDGVQVSSETALPQWSWQQVNGRVSNDMCMDISRPYKSPEQHVHNQQHSLLHALPTDKRADVCNTPTMLDVNSLQALSWFQQGQPMTRSRSAELRQKYAAMQGLSTFPTAQMTHQLTSQRIQGLTQVPLPGTFARGLAVEQATQIPWHLQSLNASNAIRPGASISNMVTMLKDSLERKRLAESTHQNQHRILGDTCTGPASEQTEPLRPAASDDIVNSGEAQGNKQNAAGNVPVCRPNVVPSTRELSPRESSGGAATLSTRVALSDGPSNSVTLSVQPNSLKRTSQSAGVVEEPRKMNNGGVLRTPQSHVSGESCLKGFPKSASVVKKQEQLARVGSLISSGRSGGAAEGMNPTKMRRVERREKMLEAKGRPLVPSDLQVALKRCDALEKEVRSLKLTVSFMNRKDSEQTKRIEELEKENQELQHEKGRLLEEVERLASCHPF